MFPIVCIIILALFLGALLIYIFKLKQELHRIQRWVENNEYIYFVNMFDKDIESLAVSINRRIREEEKKENQLRKQEKNLKKKVANLSHDLRTPLTVIIGYLQLIRLEKEPDEPIHSYLLHIEMKATYLKRLVDELYLLFWSKAIDHEIEMQDINITNVTATLLKEYIQNSKVASEQMDIQLPHEDIYVRGQEKIIIRILYNIIDNAIKYSKGDIVFCLYAKESNCYIELANQSDFISTEELKNIFELFYTKDEARINSGGIGLYTTEKLVKQLNGKITAEYYNGEFKIRIKIPLIKNVL
uniref:histidine kinase n=1 Tax=Eubacterium plexicaudatum ASF492 TaxID=1235802 RepID=N2BKJ5_9FIRM